MCSQRGFPHSSPVQSVCHWAAHSLTHPTLLSLGTSPLALPLHLLFSFLPCFWLSLFWPSLCFPSLSLFCSIPHLSLHLHFMSLLSSLCSLTARARAQKKKNGYKHRCHCQNDINWMIMLVITGLLGQNKPLLLQLTWTQCQTEGWSENEMAIPDITGFE